MNKLKYAGWLVLLMGALSALQSPFVESFWMSSMSYVANVLITVAIVYMAVALNRECRTVRTKVALGLTIAGLILYYVSAVFSSISDFLWSHHESFEDLHVIINLSSVSGISGVLFYVLLTICAVLILIQYWSNKRIRLVLFMAIVMGLLHFLYSRLFHSLGFYGFGEEVTIYDENGFCRFYSGDYIISSILDALCIFVLSAVFFVFAEKDSKSQSRNRGIDWVAFAVLLISIILFFCKWVKNADGESIIYGGHLITGGSLGLYLSLGGLLAIIFKSYRGKRNVGLAMIFWAFIAIGLAVFTPSVAYSNSSIYDVCRFLSEFGVFPELDILVLGLYSGSCLVAGILLRRAGTAPESENRPEDQRVVPATEAIDGQADQLAVSEPADNMEDPQNVPDAESDPLDDEIAKLKAELDRLKNEQNSR